MKKRVAAAAGKSTKARPVGRPPKSTAAKAAGHADRQTAANRQPTPEPQRSLRDWLLGDNERGSLTALIAGRTVQELRAVARGLGWPLTGLQRDGIVTQMVNHYLDPAMAATAVGRLDEAEKRIASAVAWAGWADFPEMERWVAALDQALPGKRAIGTRWPTPAAALFASIERGIVLSDRSARPMTLEIAYTMASDLLPVPGFPPSIAVAGLRREAACEPVGGIIAAWEVLGRHGSFALASGFTADVDRPAHGWPGYRKELTDTARRYGRDGFFDIPPVDSRVPQEIRADIAQVLGDDDPERAAFLVAQALAPAILGVTSGTTVAADSSALDGWLELPAAEMWAEAIKGWIVLDYPVWDEMSCIRRRHGDIRVCRRAHHWNFQPADFGADLADLRFRALQWLRRLPRSVAGPDDGWVDAVQLAALIGQTVPPSLFPPATTGPWFVADSGGKPLTADSPLGRAHIAQLVAFLFRGPLRWLGLVETAVDETGTLAAIRLAPAGIAWTTGAPLAVAAPAAPEWDDAARAVTLRPGAGSVSALAAARRHMVLDGVAAGGGLRYRASPEAIGRSFELGVTADEVRARFAAAGLPLPPAVAAAFDQGWARWGLIHLYTDLATVELADPLLAREVLATTDLASRIVYRASDTVFVVQTADVDGLVHALRRSGHTPRVVGGRNKAEAGT